MYSQSKTERNEETANLINEWKRWSTKRACGNDILSNHNFVKCLFRDNYKHLFSILIHIFKEIFKLPSISNIPISSDLSDSVIICNLSDKSDTENESDWSCRFNLIHRFYKNKLCKNNKAETGKKLRTS